MMAYFKWREHLGAIGLALFLSVAGSTSSLAGAREIRGFVLSVADMNRSVAFYEQALGFEKEADQTIADKNFDYLVGEFGARVHRVVLRLGDETIVLEQFLSPAGKPIPIDSRSTDLWFQHFAVVVGDMEQAFAHVSRFDIHGISSAPQTIPASNVGAAGIRAYKFKDPDGHPLELLYFPTDKGNPKWQRHSSKLFLGIDHSAIGIGNTERSIAFYRDLLGLRVTGGGVNSGSTQEQLDNAFGAVVRITGLHPEGSAGPGLEFLQYLTPPGGRPAPADTQPSDLVATRVVVEVDDLPTLVTQLQQRNVTFISPDIVSVSGMPYTKGLMVKDPDGHVVVLVQ